MLYNVNALKNNKIKCFKIMIIKIPFEVLLALPVFFLILKETIWFNLSVLKWLKSNTVINFWIDVGVF